MNENMSAGKIFVGGVGIVGLIGAAIYIYRRVKEAQKPIEIALDEQDTEVEAEEVENDEETETIEKAEKRAAITEKISSVGHKIGKTVGTFCLKFGAKHPKITKGLFTCFKYAPVGLMALMAGLLLISESIDARKQNVSIEWVPDETEPRKLEIERTDTEIPTIGWDEKYRDNFNAVKDFANTLNLFEGEMFIIEDQKQYIGTDTFMNLDEEHPIVSHLMHGNGIYPPDNEQ